MIFKSANGKTYNIKPNLSNDYWGFNTISIFDGGRGIDFRYDNNQGTIDWYYFIPKTNIEIQEIDRFAPNDLREYCRKLVKNIILL